MAAIAIGDFLAALALMLVLEGLAFALFSRRLPELLEALQTIDPDSVRWGGLAMATAGTILYLVLR